MAIDHGPWQVNVRLDRRRQREFSGRRQHTVKLPAVFWASIAGNGPVPPEAHIASLPDLERRSRGTDGIDYDAVRETMLA